MALKECLHWIIDLLCRCESINLIVYWLSVWKWNQRAEFKFRPNLLCSLFFSQNATAPQEMKKIHEYVASPYQVEQRLSARKYSVSRVYFPLQSFAFIFTQMPLRKSWIDFLYPPTNYGLNMEAWPPLPCVAKMETRNYTTIFPKKI